jgi:CHC2-type zinc finger protein
MKPVVVSYVYKSPTGEVLRRKDRYPDKTFSWWTWDPVTETWMSGAVDSGATLYMLDKIASMRPETMFVVEGEKDTDNLWALDLPATTSGNWSSWKSHHSDQLRECGCLECVILPDNDEVGMTYANTVARENLRGGIKSKIIKLPLLQVHGDVSDYIGFRVRPREEILDLAEQTPWVTPADLPYVPSPKPKSSKPSISTYVYDRRLSQFFLEVLKLPPTTRGRIQTLCPLHPDSATLSLAVDLDHGVWFCHGGCGVGGGVVQFYMKVNALRGRVVLRSEAWRRLSTTYM